MSAAVGCAIEAVCKQFGDDHAMGDAPSVEEVCQALADAGLLVDPFETKAAIAVLNSIALDGCEPARAHGEADGVLLAYVPDEVKHAYKRVEDRVGEFWYE